MRSLIETRSDRGQFVRRGGPMTGPDPGGGKPSLGKYSRRGSTSVRGSGGPRPVVRVKLPRRTDEHLAGLRGWMLNATESAHQVRALEVAEFDDLVIHEMRIAVGDDQVALPFAHRQAGRSTGRPAGGVHTVQPICAFHRRVTRRRPDRASHLDPSADLRALSAGLLYQEKRRAGRIENSVVRYAQSTDEVRPKIRLGGAMRRDRGLRRARRARCRGSVCGGPRPFRRRLLPPRVCRSGRIRGGLPRRVTMIRRRAPGRDSALERGSPLPPCFPPSRPKAGEAAALQPRGPRGRCRGSCSANSCQR